MSIHIDEDCWQEEYEEALIDGMDDEEAQDSANWK